MAHLSTYFSLEHPASSHDAKELKRELDTLPGVTSVSVSSGGQLAVDYDATGVRRAAGEQARVLNRLLMEHDKAEAQKALKEFLGHTPLEVLGGAVLGIALGFLIPIA